MVGQRRSHKHQNCHPAVEKRGREWNASKYSTCMCSRSLHGMDDGWMNDSLSELDVDWLIYVCCCGPESPTCAGGEGRMRLVSVRCLSDGWLVARS